MRKPIQIGKLIFKTKKDALAHFKLILNSYDFGQTLNSKDFNDICDLLKIHENSKEKIGSGIKKVIICEVRYNTKCFNLIRNDTTSDIFSYTKCIDGGFTALTKFSRTCRDLIYEDLRNVKLDYFKAGDVKDFIKALKENQKELELALRKLSDIIRKANMPFIDGKISLFGKTVEDYLEIDKLSGDKLSGKPLDLSGSTK